MSIAYAGSTLWSKRSEQVRGLPPASKTVPDGFAGPASPAPDRPPGALVPAPPPPPVEPVSAREEDAFCWHPPSPRMSTTTAPTVTSTGFIGSPPHPPNSKRGAGWRRKANLGLSALDTTAVGRAPFRG